MILLGVDGAAWPVIEDLINVGDLPHLQRVIERGCHGTMLSLKPSWSPIIWTSVATGVLPEIHGIQGFTHKVNGQDHLYTSDLVLSPTLWEMANEGGIAVGVTNYWFTFPVREVHGFIVSDHTLPWRSDRMQRRFASNERAQSRSGSIFPFELEEHLDALITASPAYRDSKRTTKESPKERYARMLEENRLIWLLADEAARRHPVRFEIRYLKGIDGISHHFFGYWDPDADAFKDRPLDPAKVKKYREYVPDLYRHFDGLLGGLLQTVTPEDVLIILSDHGFEAKKRARNLNLTGRHGGQNSTHGIFIFSGGPIVRRSQSQTISLLDIAPTILHLLGIAVPVEMQETADSEEGERSHGRVAIELLDPQWLADQPVRYRRPSYPRLPLAVEASEVVPEDGARIEELRQLGYFE